MTDRLMRVAFRCTITFDYIRKMRAGEKSTSDAAHNDKHEFIEFWENSRPDIEYSEYNVRVSSQDNQEALNDTLKSNILVSLSVREREVFSQMSNGLSDKEIGNLLNISLNTVKTHVKKILKKLKATSRAHAIAQVYNAPLTPLT